MDLVLAESLVAVADAGSVTSAARRIHISQSALSRRLQQLETELGVHLLTRGRHGAELTAAGRLVVGDCRVLLGRYEHMRRGLDDLMGIRQGTVRLGGGATATSALFPAAIARFRALHPGIRFLVTEAGSGPVVDEVAVGQLDIGVVTAPVTHPDVESHALIEDEIVLVAREDDPLPEIATASHLRGRGVIAFEANTAIRRIIDTHLGRRGVEADVTMELRSVPTMLNMVAATGDLAFVSRLTLGGMDLRVVPVRGLRIFRTLAVATGRSGTLAPAARAFAASLTEAAANLDGMRR